MPWRHHVPDDLPIERVATWSVAPGGGALAGEGLDELLRLPPSATPGTPAALVARALPEDAEAFARAWAAFADGRGPATLSALVRVRDGDGHVVRLRALGRRAADGALAGTFSDVTALHDQLFIQQIGLVAFDAACWRWEPATDAVTWDRRLGPIVGQAPGFTPRGLDDFLRLVHPDDRARTAQALRQGAASGTRFAFEARLLAADGSVRWVSAVAATEREPDGTVHVVGAARDVTERHQRTEALATSEQRFRRLAEHSRDVISLHDADARFVYVSPAATEVLGWRPEELVGRLPAEFAHAEDEADLADDVRAVRRGETTALPVRPYRVRAPDGRWRWIEVSRAPLFGEDGAFTGLIAISRDVSDRMQREAEARDRARQGAVTRLVGGIAHHFNNHLAAIRIHADLLGLQLPAGITLSPIVEAVDRAAALSQQLLTFTGHVPRREARRELDGLLAELLPPLQVRALEGGHAVRLEPGAPGRLVRVDERELGIALIELVANACDAMATPGTITIATHPVAPGEAPPGTRRDDAPEPEVRVVVRDTGPGLPDVAADRLFEPFFTTREFGRGLGLAVTRAIVEGAGGGITLGAGAAGGAECTLWLPCAAEATARAGRVLLVDDEPMVLRATAQGLRALGFEVLTATSGPEAIDVLEGRRGEVDVVVTDYLMPHLRGDALLRHVHACWPRVRTVMHSAYIDEPGVMTALGAAGTAFVPKPAPLAAIAAALRGALEGRGR